MSFTDSNSISSPLNISGDSQLAVQAFSGDGSSNNPYIIENITISSCSANVNGISIQNTNKYFILQNITVSYCASGFYFYNVTFGKVLNSYAMNNNYMGFDINFSSWNVFTNNEISKSGSGFYLSTSTANTLVNNTAEYNTGDGFQLVAGNNTLVNNTAEHNTGDGFQLVAGNNTLVNNTADDNAHDGITLTYSTNNNLTNNRVDNNTVNGITLTFSLNNTLINNVARKNYFIGFELYSSNNNTLVRNNADNNTYGFYVNISSWNIFKDNIGQFNQLYDYYAANSPTTILDNNTFIKSGKTPSIIQTHSNNQCSSCPVIVPIPGIIITPLWNTRGVYFNILISIVIVGLIAVLYLYHKRKNSNKDSYTYSGENVEYKINNNLHSPNNNISALRAPRGKKLKHSQRAPDFETALKAMLGGFPDYPTFKQASDKGISSFDAWIKYQKEQ